MENFLNFLNQNRDIIIALIGFAVAIAASLNQLVRNKKFQLPTFFWGVLAVWLIGSILDTGFYLSDKRLFTSSFLIPLLHLVPVLIYMIKNSYLLLNQKSWYVGGRNFTISFIVAVGFAFYFRSLNTVEMDKVGAVVSMIMLVLNFITNGISIRASFQGKTETPYLSYLYYLVLVAVRFYYLLQRDLTITAYVGLLTAAIYILQIIAINYQRKKTSQKVETKSTKVH